MFGMALGLGLLAFGGMLAGLIAASAWVIR